MSEHLTETRAAIRIRLGVAELTIDGHTSFIERVIWKVLPVIRAVGSDKTIEELASGENPEDRLATAQPFLTQRGKVNITETLRQLHVGQDVFLKTTAGYVKGVSSRTKHVYECQKDGRMLRVRRVL